MVTNNPSNIAHNKYAFRHGPVTEPNGTFAIFFVYYLSLFAMPRISKLSMAHFTMIPAFSNILHTVIVSRIFLSSINF